MHVLQYRTIVPCSGTGEADVFIPAGRRRTLELFLQNPFHERHLREISRASRVSRTSVDRSMRLLVRENMFKRREVSKMVFFRPNLESETLLKTFEFLELKKKIEFRTRNKKIARLLEKYVRDVVDLSNRRIQLVILFGSVARGEWTKGSDIDVLAVGSDKENDLIVMLNRARVDVSPLLEIRPISTTFKKFVEGFRKRTEFYDELWRDRIVLYNEFLFWQLIREGGGSHAPEDRENPG